MLICSNLQDVLLKVLPWEKCSITLRIHFAMGTIMKKGSKFEPQEDSFATAFSDYSFAK